MGDLYFFEFHKHMKAKATRSTALTVPQETLVGTGHWALHQALKSKAGPHEHRKLINW